MSSFGEGPSDPKRAKLDNNKSWSHSKMTSFDLEHIWKIDMFSKALVENSFYSPLFSVPTHDLQFKIQLASEERHLEVFLHCYSGKTVISGVSIHATLFILKKNGSIGTHKDGCFHYSDKDLKEGYGYKFPYFAEYSQVMGNMLSDRHQLTIRCKASVFYNRTTIQSFICRPTNCESSFVSNQMALLNSGDFSDIKIVIGQTEIPAHKSILAAHSPVFEAMFKLWNTLETQQDKVEILDISVDTMKVFLKYIYSGVKPNLSVLPDRLPVFLLLAAADKYQVTDLKILCENYLVSILSVINVVNALKVAYMHKALILQDHCVAFIANNFDKVVFTENWKDLGETHFELMMETTADIMLRKSGN